MNDKDFDVDCEPALRGHADLFTDPRSIDPRSVDAAEVKAAREIPPDGEAEQLRDSVANEVALPQQRDELHHHRWVEERRVGTSLLGNLLVTFLAAAVSGPAAVIGVFVAGQQGTAQAIYLIVFGPIIEELLKQSGMVYLLESKPYRLFASWQFVVSGLVAGFTFAAIENVVYIHVYAPMNGVEDIAALAAYRWTVCTALHVACSLMASFGLVRAWRLSATQHREVQLSDAAGWFIAAIVLHGLYNFASLFISALF